MATTVSAVLRVTADVRDAMFAHAVGGLPFEACGMFSAGASALVDQFHPMRNVAASAERFELAGQEMLDLERRIDETGRSVVGVMHSHTATSAYPSPTDVTDIGRFDPLASLHHVIVSLRHAEPVLRCFQVVEGRVVERPVVVADGARTPHDQAGAVAAVMRLPTPPPAD